LVNGTAGDTDTGLPPFSFQFVGVNVGVVLSGGTTPPGMVIGTVVVGTVVVGTAAGAGRGLNAGVTHESVPHVVSPHIAPHFGVKKPSSRSNNRGRASPVSHPITGTSARLLSGRYITRGRQAVAVSHPASSFRTGRLTPPHPPRFNSPGVAHVPLAHPPASQPAEGVHGKYVRRGARYGTGPPPNPTGVGR
jgi:hypothetical protein